MSGAHEAVITGIGIVSSLGEGPEAHWAALSNPTMTADTTTFAPFVVHPIVPLALDTQIPKKGDQRQMEPWQRIGTYAAGLALDSAGLKGDATLLAQTDMIVAAGGGERDVTVDGAILTELVKADKPGSALNARLMSDLRPTLFLAQLSNLLAGNISIVHGVTGSSRTFMGEEASGIDAVRIAQARIASGQSDIALVGGAHNGERKDMLMLYAFGGFALKEACPPVWQRSGPTGGFALGSLGAFLVLEAKDHAEARGAKMFARLTSVVSDRADRDSGSVTDMLEALWSRLGTTIGEGHSAVISGATGAQPATRDEAAFLGRHAALPVRGTGTALGHGMEAQFPMNVALAALAVQHGRLFAPQSDASIEKPMDGTLSQVVVTGVGHWRGEGLALVEALD
jgi:3-oxoacyl-[acyl-carrier-protein] synthase II